MSSRIDEQLVDWVIEARATSRHPRRVKNMKESSGLSRFHFVVLFVTLFLISESKLWPNASGYSPNILDSR